MPTLDWIGKKAVVNHHREVPFRLLQCDPELSVGDPDSGNLLVQGDNLEALKALLPYYAGKVKCIYIDPPYNTGSENWIYNDNVNSPESKAWLGKVVGGEMEDLSRHDKWLCMMYPRLALLREFLSEDGAILISIDDNEADSLRKIMDEVFGPQNFVARLIWEKGRKNDAKLFSVGHEYVVVYVRSLATLKSRGVIWRREKEGAKEIHAEYLRLRATHGNDFNLIEIGLREFYRSLPRGHASRKHVRYNKVDASGVWRDDNMSWPGGGGPRYDVVHPVTGQPCRVPDGGWRYATPEKMQEMIGQGKVVFRADHSEPPIRKTYLVRDNRFEEDDDEDVGREVMGTYFYRSGIQAANVLASIFGDKIFPNPKDHEIIGDLISYVTRYDKEVFVLDSFAGSGTTGHAVLAQNKADGGNRRFILVEMDPKICREVTAERLKRVIDGYGDQEPLGGGFRYCTLGEPLFDERGAIRSSVKFHELAAHVFFTETGSPIPKKASGKTPLLGIHNGVAVYLLYNGVLEDKAPGGGNVLTTSLLPHLFGHDGDKVVYGTACRLGPERLRREGIVFKQLPYKLRVGAL